MSSENRIRELVYAGNVLDEHGNWISLAEKINRERTFLSHLEQGEVLIDGLWTRIADALQPESENTPQTDKALAPNPDIVPPDCALEETISISSDALESATKGAASRKNEVDFPPETQMFSLVFPDSEQATPPPPPPPTRPEMVFVTEETQVDISMSKIVAESGKKAADHVSNETEFEETVLYNINAPKGEQVSAGGDKKALHTDDSPTPTTAHELNDEPPRNNIRLIAAVATIITIGILIGFFLSTL